MTVSSTKESLPKKDVELTSRPPAAAPLPGGATATLRRTARRETRRSSRRDTGTRVVRNRRLCNVSPGVSIPAASGAAPRQSVSRAATAQSIVRSRLLHHHHCRQTALASVATRTARRASTASTPCRLARIVIHELRLGRAVVASHLSRTVERFRGAAWPPRRA